MHVLLPVTHPLAGRETVLFAALQGDPFILFETGFALNGIILDACRSAGLAPDIVARSSQINFIVELVAAGLGVGFLPRPIAEQRQRPGVSRTLVVEPEMEWLIAWIWGRGCYLSHAGKSWLDLAAEIATKS